MTDKEFQQFCGQQVARFDGCTGWVDPNLNPGPGRDLVATLAKLSKGSREFVQRLVDKWKQSSRFCPTVSELTRMAEEIRNADRPAPDPRVTIGCKKCDFTGWRLEIRGGYDFSIRCECSSVTPAPTQKPPAKKDFAQLAAGDRD